MAPQPNIEPHGLNIGATSVIIPPNSVGGGWAAGERQEKELGGLEPSKCEMGAGLAPKPNIEPHGLNIGGRLE